MSKGSRSRPCDKQRFDENYARVFGKKRPNVCRDAPPKEESEEPCPGCGGSGYLEGANWCPCREKDADEIQGSTRDGTRDRTSSGRVAQVPQEPGRALDSQTAEPVEPPPRGNRQALPGRYPLDTDYWTDPGYRGEFNCPHGVGHGNHIHGCCEEQCCQRADFPLRKDR
jgi:hypothetical protein